MNEVQDKKVWRIIDANFNRAKEGLRVCEDIGRFVAEREKVARDCKLLRQKVSHVVSAWGLDKAIQARNIEGDVGRKTSKRESQRGSTKDIFYANAQRVKESLRVLEEFGKLVDRRSAESLKKLRYQFYHVEKEFLCGPLRRDDRSGQGRRMDRPAL